MSNPTTPSQCGIEQDLMNMIDDYLSKSCIKYTMKARTDIVLSTARIYARTTDIGEDLIDEVLDEYHSSQEAIKGMLHTMMKAYIKSQSGTWSKSFVETPLKSKERLNKISALKETLGRVQEQIKEYTEVLERLFNGIISPQEAFSYLKDGEAQTFESLSEADSSLVKLKLMCCEKMSRKLLQSVKDKELKILNILDELGSQSHCTKDFILR